MAKSIGRVGILRDGTRVTVLEVIRVLSKNPKIVVTSWLDCSGSGADVYRLVDGRVLLAEFVELTDETVEFTPRKKPYRSQRLIRIVPIRRPNPRNPAKNCGLDKLSSRYTKKIRLSLDLSTARKLKLKF